MAKIRINLRRNPETGKQDLLVDLQSDDDLMQFEHERLHAQIIDDLVRCGVDVDQLGEIVVEREEHGFDAEPANSAASEIDGATEPATATSEGADVDVDHNEGHTAS